MGDGALDKVRREVWWEAHAEAVQASKAKAETIKNSAYAPGKAPDHLKETQQPRIAMIAEEQQQALPYEGDPTSFSQDQRYQRSRDRARARPVAGVGKSQ